FRGLGDVLRPGRRGRIAASFRLNEISDQHDVIDRATAFAGQGFAVRRPGEAVDAVTPEVSHLPGLAAVYRLAPDVRDPVDRHDEMERAAVWRPLDGAIIRRQSALTDDHRLPAVNRDYRQLHHLHLRLRLRVKHKASDPPAVRRDDRVI